jgi:hypothetical protein
MDEEAKYARVFLRGKPFQLYVIFVSKAKAYLEICPTRVSSDHIDEYLAKLERIATDNVAYSASLSATPGKKVYNIDNRTLL